MTKIKLVFIKDKELSLFLENKIREGYSSDMGDRHVVLDVKKQIVYVDANNLYGWAMSQYLPTGEFEKLQLCWVPFNPNTEQSCNYNLEQLVQDLLQIPDNNTYGFFILCD